MDFDQLGPYRIVRKLGQGGMGAVYEGIDEHGNKAAIKTLTPALASQRGFRARFEVEIETLRRLEHDNIVRIYGFGEQQDQLFYVMELVNGWSLEHVRQGRKQLSWRQVIDIGKQVCKALKHAHDRGIIHRDIKPANIMITPSGQVKLSDFGIAHMWGLTGLTVEGGILGTATYMSPEQADGIKATTRSDLYSVGCVLYALLAGRPPFRSNSVTEMLRLQRSAKPDSVTKYAPDVPPELDLILMGLLEKDPLKRIATAAMLAKSLQAVEDAVALRSGEDTLDARDLPVTQDAPAAPDHDELQDQVTLTHGPASPAPPSAPPRASDELTVAPPPGRAAPPPAPDHSADVTIARATPAPTAASGAPASSTPKPADDVATRTLASADIAPRQPAPAPYALDAAQESPPSRHTAAAAHTAEASRSTFITAEQAAERDRMIAMEQQRRPTVITVGSIVLAAVLLLGVPVTIWWTRPPSADQLHRFIIASFESGSTERMLDSEVSVRQFLRMYPDDPRVEQVRQYQDEIDLITLERRLQFRSRHLGRAQTTSPLERAYLEALSHARANPEAGLERLNAMLVLYGDPDKLSDEEKPYVELARRQATRLQQQINEYAGQHIMRLRGELAHAADLRHSDAAAAAAIYRAILSLYGDKPWAQAIVQQSRDALQSLSTTPTSNEAAPTPSPDSPPAAGQAD